MDDQGSRPEQNSMATRLRQLRTYGIVLAIRSGDRSRADWLQTRSSHVRTHESARSARVRRQEQMVRLSTPVPVHLLYWTVWADEDGTLRFPDDVYSRDRVLKRALDQAPPARWQ